MKRLNKILVAVLVAQVGIIAVGRALVHRNHGTSFRKLFPELNTDDIKELKITGDDKTTVVLKKNGDAWNLASHGGYPIAKEKVTELLGKLPGLASTQLVATKRSHHRTLEVADEQYKRRVALAAGDKTHNMLLGSSPAIKSVHFRFADEDDVYLVKGLSPWDLGTTATNWVDNKYFKVEKDKVVNIQLTTPKGQLQLAKASDGQWKVANLDPSVELDSSAIQSFVNSASSVFLQEPVGKEIKPEYGLAPAKMTLIVTTETPIEAKDGEKPAGASAGAEQTATAAATPSSETAADATPIDAPLTPPTPEVVRKTYTLTIGNQEPNDDDAQKKYYAKSSQSEFVVLIGGWAAEQLSKKTAEDLVKKEKKDEGAPGMPPGMPSGMPPGMPSGMPPLS